MRVGRFTSKLRGLSPNSYTSGMSFRDKAGIVTGATSGIGLATAQALGREGASVVLVGRNESALSQTSVAVRSAGGQAIVCAQDVTAAAAPDRIVGAAVAAYGRLDVLINAAGVIAAGTLEATTDALWGAMMAAHARAPVRLLQ